VVDNEDLSTANISGISRAPKGAVQIEISFSLDQECLLGVSSRELASGKPLTTKLVKEKFSP
jgi:molecular chaperone DnaK (HSP70)